MKYLRLNPQWKMRRDDKQVLLILLSTLEVRYISLKPYAAIIISALDGITPELEVIKKLSIWFKEPLEKVKQTLDTLTKDLNHYSREFPAIESLSKPSTAQSKHSVKDFILPKKEYQFSTKLQTPTHALIYLSGSCQTSCQYCYADTDHLCQYPLLSYEEWLPIIEDLHKNKVYNITFAGGDSGTHPNYAKILAATCDPDTLVFFSTKCFISYESAKTLVEGGWNEPVNGAVKREFQLSVDSLDEKTCQTMLKVKGFSKRAITSVENLLKAGIRPKIKGVMTPYNDRQVGDVVKHFVGMGITSFFFTLYADSFYRHDEKMSLSDQRKQELRILLEELKDQYPQIVIEGDAIRYQSSPQNLDQTPSIESVKNNWSQRSNCSSGRSNFVIAPDGSVLLCEQLPSSKNFVVGNLREQSIEEVWNSEPLHAITHPKRESFKKTICFDCEEFEDCVQVRGQCFRDNHFDFHTLYHPQKICPRYLAINT